ncbi:MAG: hypothetical protein OEX19_04045, partial [Gammaproteobacteria bacterium]|nr:hypothetical protein [Gammaproteobacteria bacterium]
ALDDDPDIVVVLDYGVGDPETYNVNKTIPNVGTKELTGTNRSVLTITEYDTIQQERVRYFRYITLRAFDGKSVRNKKPVEIWRTNIESAGRSSDLRRLFPAMIASSFDYIGVDTGQIISVTLYENDPRIAFLKKHKR